MTFAKTKNFFLQNTSGGLFWTAVRSFTIVIMDVITEESLMMIIKAIIVAITSKILAEISQDSTSAKRYKKN